MLATRVQAASVQAGRVQAARVQTAKPTTNLFLAGGCSPSLVARDGSCYQWSPLDGGEQETPWSVLSPQLHFIISNYPKHCTDWYFSNSAQLKTRFICEQAAVSRNKQ